MIQRLNSSLKQKNINLINRKIQKPSQRMRNIRTKTRPDNTMPSRSIARIKFLNTQKTKPNQKQNKPRSKQVLCHEKDNLFKSKSQSFTIEFGRHGVKKITSTVKSFVLQVNRHIRSSDTNVKSFGLVLLVFGFLLLYQTA